MNLKYENSNSDFRINSGRIFRNTCPLELIHRYGFLYLRGVIIHDIYDQYVRIMIYRSNVCTTDWSYVFLNFGSKPHSQRYSPSVPINLTYWTGELTYQKLITSCYTIRSPLFIFFTLQFWRRFAPGDKRRSWRNRNHKH